MISETDSTVIASSDSSSSSFYNTPCESPSAYSEVDSASFQFSASNIPLSLNFAQFPPGRDVEGDLRPSGLANYEAESCRSTPSVETTCTLRSFSVNNMPPQTKPFGPPDQSPSDRVNRDLRKKFATMSVGEKPSLHLALEKLNGLNQQAYQITGFQKQLEFICRRMEEIQRDISVKVDEVSNILYAIASSSVPLPSVIEASSQPFPGSSSKLPVASPKIAVTASTRIAQSSIIPKNDSKIFATESSHFKKPSSSRSAKPEGGDNFTTLTPELKHKLRRLPAMVKGFLIRRLAKTETVQELMKTIKDTLVELEAFKADDVKSEEDVILHERLMIQLERSMEQYYNIFIRYSVPNRMKLIARSRELHRERSFSRPSSRYSLAGGSIPLSMAENIMNAHSQAPHTKPKKVQVSFSKKQETLTKIKEITEVAPETVKRTRKTAQASNENKSPRPTRRTRESTKAATKKPAFKTSARSN